MADPFKPFESEDFTSNLYAGMYKSLKTRETITLDEIADSALADFDIARL